VPTFEASVGVPGWTLLIDVALALDGRRFQQHVVAAPRGKVIDHIEIKRSSGMGALCGATGRTTPVSRSRSRTCSTSKTSTCQTPM
jgi:hypothetical protein